MTTESNQMVVYRVESRTRVGMYQASSIAHEQLCDMEQHPGPLRDNRLMDEADVKGMRSPEFWLNFNQDCRFGFASKKQMRNWISEDSWKAKLAEEGLIVAKYQVPKAHVAIGTSQAIFRPMNATLLATMCPTKI